MPDSPLPPDGPSQRPPGWWSAARRVRPVSADPLVVVPPDVLARHHARVLDPATATKVADQRPIRTTVYLPDRLIVAGSVEPATFDLLVEAAADNGLVASIPDDRAERRARLLAVADEARLPDAAALFPTLVHLDPAPGRAVVPDAWAVLQTFRARVGPDLVPGQVSLDHLLTATPHIFGSPFDPGADAPTSSYGRPGSGGRMPVSWGGAMPARDREFSGRRPVVAVLDTGCGSHTWFDGVVTRNATVGGVAVGLQDPGDDPELTGVIEDPLEGVLDPDAGHGTFIAGLIRQSCPDADVLAVRVMTGDGAVPEHVLLDALGLLAVRQHQAQQTQTPGDVIDVVSLSLGYYHEQDESGAVDQVLLTSLDALGSMGVAVVVAAGNDATTRPMYPAAFYPHGGGTIPAPSSDQVPVLSVGAQNPDATIALFSNAGSWVACHRAGANVVSTFPVTFDGSRSADVTVGPRSTIDPDDFSGGFGVWSGTSFAAPVLAGELAQTMVDEGSLDSVDPGSSVDRAWRAVTACVGTARP